MDSTTSFIVGLLIMQAVQILLGGTAVFVVRRWKRIDPAWSWAKTLGAFFLLVLFASGVGLLVPVIGRFAALVVSLVGVKRLSGLDILSSIILSLCLGVPVFVVAAILSGVLQVDLLGLRQ